MSRTHSHTHHASNGPGHGSATDDLKDKAGKVGQDLKDVAARCAM